MAETTNRPVLRNSGSRPMDSQKSDRWARFELVKPASRGLNMPGGATVQDIASHCGGSRDENTRDIIVRVGKRLRIKATD